MSVPGLPRTPILLLAALILARAGSADAQPAFETAGESFDVPLGAVFSSAVSVLANDSVSPADSLVAELVSGPAQGTLTFRADGTFDYDPAGASGVQVFTYRAATLPTQRLNLIPDESVLLFDAEVDPDQLAARSDMEEVAFKGELYADLGPDGRVTDPMQILGLSAVNRDQVTLFFDWGEIIGTLTVEAEPDSLLLEMRQAGPAVSADAGDGSFTQTGNILGITVVADVTATGFLSGAVEDGTQILETDTAFNLGGTVDIGAPIVVEFEVATFNVFDLDGNDVTVETSGTLRATGQPVVRVTSDPVEVMLNIAEDTALEDNVLPGRVRLGTVFPNPVRGTATILLSGTPSSPVSLELVDMLGRTVRTMSVAGDRAEMDVSGLASGVYVVRLTDAPSRALTLIVR
ncbi:MAG: T9SS type A sorting domain-containing protein [Rhodothermales bacterium]|nr:T9SS type A sorting domain-containing protein [Rhodothermales bacterium]